MTPNENKNVKDAPSREDLEKQAFCVLMKLDEKTRNALLVPYEEKYRWKLNVC